MSLQPTVQFFKPNTQLKDVKLTPSKLDEFEYPVSQFVGESFLTYKFPQLFTEFLPLHPSQIDMDKSLTVKNMLEGLTILHLTFGKLPDSELSIKTGQLLDRHLSKVRDWGILATTAPKNVLKFTHKILTPYVLNKLEDRVRFLFYTTEVSNRFDTHLIIGDAFIQVGRDDMKKIGGSLANHCDKLLKIINKYGGVGYDPIHFINRYFGLCVQSKYVGPMLRRFEEHVDFPYHSGLYFEALEGKADIYKVLKLIYFGQYRTWYNSGTWVDVKGTAIYVDHHTVYENLDFEHFVTKRLKRLPFGSHPKDVFGEYIKTLAEDAHEEGSRYNSPKELVMTNLVAGVRQLTTGIDLVNEGNVMEHCIGGEDYRYELDSGEEMYFHLDVDGFKHGATLALRANNTRGEWGFGGRFWKVSEFHGFDDESILSAETPFANAANKALTHFLKQCFYLATPQTVRSIERIKEFEFRTPYCGLLETKNGSVRWVNKDAKKVFGWMVSRLDANFVDPDTGLLLGELVNNDGISPAMTHQLTGRHHGIDDITHLYPNALELLGYDTEGLDLERYGLFGTRQPSLVTEGTFPHPIRMACQKEIGPSELASALGSCVKPITVTKEL